jgi:hypothetical protein
MKIIERSLKENYRKNIIYSIDTIKLLRSIDKYPWLNFKPGKTNLKGKDIPVWLTSSLG